jgi:hypothetical protein
LIGDDYIELDVITEEAGARRAPPAHHLDKYGLGDRHPQQPGRAVGDTPERRYRTTAWPAATKMPNGTSVGAVPPRAHAVDVRDVIVSGERCRRLA